MYTCFELMQVSGSSAPPPPAPPLPPHGVSNDNDDEGISEMNNSYH